MKNRDKPPWMQETESADFFGRIFPQYLDQEVANDIEEKTETSLADFRSHDAWDTINDRETRIHGEENSSWEKI